MSRDKNVDFTGVLSCRVTKMLTLLEFYHVARHCLNACDIIFSACDKFS